MSLGGFVYWAGIGRRILVEFIEPVKVCSVWSLSWRRLIGTVTFADLQRIIPGLILRS